MGCLQGKGCTGWGQVVPTASGPMSPGVQHPQAASQPQAGKHRWLWGLKEPSATLRKVKRGEKGGGGKKKEGESGGAERHFCGIAGSPAQLSPHTASLRLPDLSILH